MNIATSAEKKSGFAFDRFVSRYLPESLKSSTLVWAFLPTFFILFSVGIGFLQPTTLTKYLPFLALMTVASCVRFRTKGLIGSYLALALFSFFFLKELEVDERLWQMGVMFSLAINLFIALLSIEEIETCLDEMRHHSKESSALLHQTELNFQHASKTWEEERQDFEAEIGRLKEEAEQRRIEKAQDTERFELVKSEIEMLTSQKEELLNEARSIRQEAASETEQKHEPTYDNRADLIAAQELILVLQQKQADISHKHLNQSEPIACEKSELAPPLPVEESKSEEIRHLNKARAQAEGLYSQLRLQFEEKSRILSQTRSELFRTQGKLQAIEREAQASQIDPNREEIKVCERLVGNLAIETEQLEQEITHLEELISHILLQ